MNNSCNSKIIRLLNCERSNFITRKEKLKAFLEMLSETPDSSEITTILEILNQYTFDNRLKLKGTLTRYIIDSSEVDYSIGEKVIEFDTNIR